MSFCFSTSLRPKLSIQCMTEGSVTSSALIMMFSWSEPPIRLFNLSKSFKGLRSCGMKFLILVWIPTCSSAYSPPIVNRLAIPITINGFFAIVTVKCPRNRPKPSVLSFFVIFSALVVLLLLPPLWRAFFNAFFSALLSNRYSTGNSINIDTK